MEIAQGFSGGSARVANFILAWWNADEQGGFDLVDLWGCDLEIVRDMQIVFAYIARAQHYPDVLGYEQQVQRIIDIWRRPRKRRVKG